jgi:hypothetical protein
MRRSMIRRWALPAVFWLAIEDGAPFCAEVPAGPKWLQTAVFYQIYPQSYYDSNGDGIGDLPSITAKLDYIYSTGCNAIWLNPIFESPSGDAGYDVADFYRVAARYGTNDGFKYLCADSVRYLCKARYPTPDTWTWTRFRSAFSPWNSWGW